MYLHGSSRINEKGHLEIGGCDTVELIKEFGTPLIVYDEQLIRNRCRQFIKAFKETGINFQVAYASKAFMSIAMVQLVDEEGLSLDVVSGGELYTALQAEFPPDRIHFHGNNKTRAELEMALDANIGCIVIDNFYEIELLDELLRTRDQEAKVLIRITPGIQASTHKYIQTGQEDSKFGFDLESGQVLAAIRKISTIPKLKLLGLHTHIGSQIFETDGFLVAITKIVDFIKNTELTKSFSVLNVGGGFGIRYTKEDQPISIDVFIKRIVGKIQETFAKADLPLPEIWVEPGRSIVGEAGTTLYTIGSWKEVPGIRNYIAVDGGMSDNLRPALYQAIYEGMIANRGLEKADIVYSISGKLCESGDMLIWDLPLPKANPGDILAVSSTGAYGYSMANNYNRIPRPAVIFVRNGEAHLIIRRESYADLTQYDLRLPKTIQS